MPFLSCKKPAIVASCFCRKTKITWNWFDFSTTIPKYALYVCMFTSFAKSVVILSFWNCSWKDSERKIEQQKEKITDTWTECRGTKNTIEWSGYSGGWLNGKRHYGGTYWNADGETYSGGFKNGERHGFGVQQSQGGILMEGQFKDGQFKEEPWWKLWW